jgi:hypothetical protein
MTRAFSSNTQNNMMTPNPKDPLFIQLRIQSNDVSIYPQIVKSINDNLSSKKYNGSLNPFQARMKAINQKVILIVDGPPNWATLSPDLASSCNIIAGTSYMSNYEADLLLRMAINPPLVDNSNEEKAKTTNTKNEILVLSKCDSANPDTRNMIANYGAQIICMQFHKNDNGLAEYERLFNQYSAGIGPLSYMVNNIRYDGTNR